MNKADDLVNRQMYAIDYIARALAAGLIVCDEPHDPILFVWLAGFRSHITGRKLEFEFSQLCDAKMPAARDVICRDYFVLSRRGAHKMRPSGFRKMREIVAKQNFSLTESGKKRLGELSPN